MLTLTIFLIIGIGIGVFANNFIRSKLPIFDTDKKLDALAKNLKKKFKHIPDHFDVEDVQNDN